MASTPGAIRRRAPDLGEHNEAVLVEGLGVPRDAFDELVGAGVVRSAAV